MFSGFTQIGMDVFFSGPIDLTQRFLAKHNKGHPVYYYRLSYQSKYAMHKFKDNPLNGIAEEGFFDDFFLFFLYCKKKKKNFFQEPHILTTLDTYSTQNYFTRPPILRTVSIDLERRWSVCGLTLLNTGKRKNIQNIYDIRIYEKNVQ